MIFFSRFVTVLLLLAICVWAYGHGDTRPSSGEQQQDQRHHHDFPAAVNGFHHTLARLWHSQPGPERARAICDHASDLRTLAHDVDVGPLPDGARDDSAGWSRAVKNMVMSVDQLMSVCSGPESGNSELALAQVHQAFHGVVAYLGHRH